MNESRKIFGSSTLLVQAGVVLTSCFIGAGFVWVLRPQPEPSAPQTDIVEMLDRSRSSRDLTVLGRLTPPRTEQPPRQLAL